MADSIAPGPNGLGAKSAPNFRTSVLASGRPDTPKWDLLARGFELEADDRAVLPMAGAGWDPEGLVRYIGR